MGNQGGQDYQRLNSRYKRETYQLTIPTVFKGTTKHKKTVLDAMDSYYSVPLNEESQPLRSFIMEWDHSMCLRMLQGYLASSDAYTHRYDKIIKNIPCKVKVVDDTVVYQ